MKTGRKVRPGHLFRFAVCTICAAGLLACGGGGQTVATVGADAPASAPGPAPSPVGPIQNPILFAAQVPTLGDFASRASTFGNHRADLVQIGRAHV